MKLPPIPPTAIPRRTQVSRSSIDAVEKTVLQILSLIRIVIETGGTSDSVQLAVNPVFLSHRVNNGRQIAIPMPVAVEAIEILPTFLIAGTVIEPKVAGRSVLTMLKPVLVIGIATVLPLSRRPVVTM
jgi:hypothetical protein